MTDESSKTRAVRGQDFESKYLRGRVIDIGCGPDLIVPHAEPFDVADGDAQEIANLRAHEAYDAVCSSHCLEHMKDVPKALRQWWKLVRKGGYMILVVPDEDLYEQGGWPSLFNRDHKATFRLGGHMSWSPASYDIAELVGQLECAEIVSCVRQDQGYNYSLQRFKLTRVHRVLYRTQQLSCGLAHALGMRSESQIRTIKGLFQKLGAPVDQTQNSALAQIQVILRKGH
jgi:SAM-dependent methyltransferase